MSGEKEDITIFDTRAHTKEFIEKNYEPVDNMPGYVWFNKRNFQMIKIETLAEALIGAWGYGKVIVQMRLPKV